MHHVNENETVVFEGSISVDDLKAAMETIPKRTIANYLGEQSSLYLSAKYFHLTILNGNKS